MGVIISVTNQKGGVAKTLTTSSIASILTEQGYKVLIISADPQRNLDMIAGENALIPPNDITSPSLLHVLHGSVDIRDAIIHTRIGDLVRSSMHLTQWQGEDLITVEEYEANKNDLKALQQLLEQRFVEAERRKSTLFRILYKVKPDYDYILIDTNPSLTLLTLNSIYASDYVLIPAFAEEASLSAVYELADTISTLLFYNKGRDIRIIGILMTKIEKVLLAVPRYTELYQKAAAQLNTRLFKTKIRKSARAMDYIDAGWDLVSYDPRGKATQDYRDFVEELKQAIEEEEATKR